VCPSLRALVVWLRGQKERAGLTYVQMAEQPECTVAASTLSRADDGSRLPTRQTVHAYAAACGADPAQAERLWCRARYRFRQQRQARRIGPRPETVLDFADLRQAMAELRERCGGPSLAQLSRHAPTGLLPRSTLGAVLRGTALPRKDLMLAFVRALGVQDTRVWERAWDKAAQTRSQLRQVDPRHTVVEGNKVYLLLDPHTHRGGNVPTYHPSEHLRSLFRNRAQQQDRNRRVAGMPFTTCNPGGFDEWWLSPSTGVLSNPGGALQSDEAHGQQILQAKRPSPHARE